MSDLNQQRQQMVVEQLQQHIRDQRVLAAIARIPRHEFMPLEVQHLAYADRAVPIGTGQTISQPYIVAVMAEVLQLQATDRVLEIGAGSGYAAAVLAELAAHVISVERHADLAHQAQIVLDRLQYQNIEIIVADGTLGWPASAPYNAISVPAAAPHVPQDLLDQLADGGRLVIPLGDRQNQQLVRFTRDGEYFQQTVISAVRFVPLIGEYGWQ